MTAIVASYLATIAIAWSFEIGAGLIGKARGKPFPSGGTLGKSLGLNAVMTTVITIGIAAAFRGTGFSESQFFRPSDRDYGQHEELGLAPEEVFFTAEDGTRLFGWFLPADREPLGTVLHFHGSDRNVSGTIRNSHWLTQHGFNVFAFDYRGYGRSEGEPSREGVLADGIAAIEYVRARSDVDSERLVLWGQSMGGQLAILAADRAGTEGIRSVIAEATYGSPRHHVKDKLAQMGPLWLVQWAVWLVSSDRLAALDVVQELAPTPLLVVHGTEDTGVRPYHGRRLYDAAGEPKELWWVEGARHLRVFTEPEWRERLVAYLRDRLPSPETTALR